MIGKKKGSAIATVLVACLLGIASCQAEDMFECEHNLRGEKASTNGLLKAAILDVKCGASTADASWILLTTAKAKVAGERDRVAVFEGRVREVVWEGPNLLVVYGDAKAISTTPAFQGTQILYHQNPK